MNEREAHLVDSMRERSGKEQSALWRPQLFAAGVRTVVEMADGISWRRWSLRFDRKLGSVVFFSMGTPSDLNLARKKTGLELRLYHKPFQVII